MVTSLLTGGGQCRVVVATPLVACDVSLAGRRLGDADRAAAAPEQHYWRRRHPYDDYDHLRLGRHGHQRRPLFNRRALLLRLDPILG
jgi:hypothetical protein